MNRKTFEDYVREQEIIDTPSDPRGTLEDIMGFLNSLEPKDIADCQDLLIELQEGLGEHYVWRRVVVNFRTWLESTVKFSNVQEAIKKDPWSYVVDGGRWKFEPRTIWDELV